MSPKSLTLFASILTLTACTNNSSDTSKNISKSTEVAQVEGVKVIIDIGSIVGKSIDEVEKILGKAESTEKVKGYPCKNTNCRRAYFKNGGYEIIFKKSKADRITINGVPDLTSNDNAVTALGLVSSNPSFKNPNNVIRWTNREGIKEISFFSDYILVQATEPD